MPTPQIDVDKLGVSADVPERVRRLRSVVMSIIGTVLLVTDVIGMLIVNHIRSGFDVATEVLEQVDGTYYAEIIFETSCVISLVLFFLAFLQHKKNTPFKIFSVLWVIYIAYFILAMSTGIKFI